MGLSRRNAIIGLGGLIAGGGALVGTGAFTTVQAERTVNVETAGDASAFLALIPTDDSPSGDNIQPNSDEYENGAYAQVTDGTVEIVLDGQNVPGDGLNQNAVTTIDNIVYVVNNGTQPVTSLNFTLDVTGVSNATDHEDALSITSGSAKISAAGNDNLLTQSDVHGAASSSPGGNDLNAGEKVPFGLEVDLLNSNISDFDPSATVTLTIEAGTA